MSDSVSSQDTVDLAFDVFGSQNPQPLIIIHGFFASSRNWRSHAKELAKKYGVYSVDMRNHGASPHSPEMNYQSMANDLAHFIQSNQLHQPHLLGHSMGGKVAMWLALNQPEAVGKLIVADISPTEYNHSFDTTINALKDLPTEQISNRKQADEWLASAIEEADYRQFLLQNLQLIEGEYQWRVNLDFFANNAPDIVGFPDANSLSPYQQECLFLGGEFSDYIRLDDVDRLFPLAKVVTVQNAAHWLHVQNPRQFLDEVETFLR